MSDSDQPVLCERRGPVLVITLNRPAARNAVNAAMAAALGAALDGLDAEAQLLAGVITGAPPAFSAGMDLKAFAAGERPWIDGRGFAGITEYGSRKPLIAAIEGFALAGGLEVALACDLIVAARDARFAIPEVKRGLFAAAGALLRLPRALPYQLAAEMALTGEPQTAERLHALGLVNRLAGPGEALGEALALATAITANSPLAVRTSKLVLREQGDWPSALAWERHAELLAEILAAPDAMEGALAFAQKRPPAWQTA
ncbi:MAG TPA: crotonase/enoyl-CoA hydratase family protein [Solirubrobacteraceae bacterium]|nr:crotonase/enoyl-CoA hydratase family protein [Solirubrobacteraceae bacterium]